MVTALVAVLLAVVPGGLLGFAVPAGPARWTAWATAPISTLGLTAAGMAWLPRLGLPNSAGWVLAVELVLAAVAVAVGQTVLLRERRAGAPLSEPRPLAARAPQPVTVGAGGNEVEPAPSGPAPESPAASGTAPRPRRPWWRPGTPGTRLWGRSRRADLVSAGIAALITVGFGRLLVGRVPFPPGWDGMNHGLLTRNIMVTGSTSISSACTDGSTHTQVSCLFYPLAADVAWAQIATFSGGLVSTAMTDWAWLIGPLALVAALYAVVRALGGTAVVAGCVAALPAVVGPLWEAMYTGRVTEEVGPGLSVAVGLLLALALRGRYPVRFGLLGGLGAAGLAMTHTYDALFAVTVALALACFLPGRLRWSAIWRAGVAAAIALLLTLAPLGSALLGAHGERTSNPPAFEGRYFRAFQYWVTDFNRYVLYSYPGPGGATAHQDVGTVRIALWLTLACLLASPLCFVFRRLRWARPWLVLLVLWTVLGYWASVSNSGAARFLDSLWYGVLHRVQVMILPVYAAVAVAGACGIGLCLSALAGRLKRPSVARRERLAASFGAAAALLLAVPLLALGATSSARTPLRDALLGNLPTSPAYSRVFSWLDHNVKPGNVVAYDRHRNFMTWSYADWGTPLLFGIPPVVSGTPQAEDYAQRWTAWNWLVDNPPAKGQPTPPEPGCLVRKFKIQYVAVSNDHIRSGATHYNRRRLARSPNLQLVHRDHGVRVYEVTSAGAACPSAG